MQHHSHLDRMDFLTATAENYLPHRYAQEASFATLCHSSHFVRDDLGKTEEHMASVNIKEINTTKIILLMSA